MAGSEPPVWESSRNLNEPDGLLSPDDPYELPHAWRRARQIGKFPIGAWQRDIACRTNGSNGLGSCRYRWPVSTWSSRFPAGPIRTLNVNVTRVLRLDALKANKDGQGDCLDLSLFIGACRQAGGEPCPGRPGKLLPRPSVNPTMTARTKTNNTFPGLLFGAVGPRDRRCVW